jgi:hypothetical protein
MNLLHFSNANGITHHKGMMREAKNHKQGKSGNERPFPFNGFHIP